MKKFLYSFAMFIGFISITNTNNLIAQDFLWAKQIGNQNEEGVCSIITDVSGNVYTTGCFIGTVDFDPGSGTDYLTSAGENDVYISKLDASGNFLWAKQLGGVSSELSYSITTDASGNVYTTGYFGGTADFDPGPGTYYLTSNYFTDIFISKLDSLGDFLWAKQLSGESNEIGYSIVTDVYGNVYTNGFFSGTVDFDPGTGTYNLTSEGENDVFISKLDASGNFLWAKQLGGLYEDYAFSVSTDIYGNVYTTGKFWGIADFNPGSGTYTLTSAGEYDIFISKLNSAGNFVWAKQIGGLNSDNANSSAVDSYGNVYTTGYFWGIVDFDPGSGTYNLTATNSADVFISKLDVSGNFEWAKQIGGVAYDISNCITTDASGYVYTTGSFSDTVDFDPGSGITNLSSAGDMDVFVCKLDASGNFIWAENFGGIHDDTGCCSTTDDSGNVYTTGCFYGTADFDPGPGYFNMTSAGNEDVFILKTTSCSVPASPMAVNSQIYAGNSVIDSLTASGTNILWYNVATGGTVLPGSTTLNDDSTYYVSQSFGGCESPRTAVTVNKISEAVQTFCSPATVADLVTTPSPGSTAFWYDSESATTPLNITDSLTSGNYYVEQNTSSAAKSLGREFSSIDGKAVETDGIIQRTDFENNAVNRILSDSISNRVMIQVEVNTNMSVSVSIQASTNNECEGIPVTYTATPTNGGASPSYQWQVNGTIAGINLSTYTYSPSNNDTVKVIMTSTEVCTSGILATSNTISMTVIPLLVSSVSISSSTNNECEGTPVTYSATPTNGGSGPSYQWQVNGVNVGTDSGIFTYNPSNNDAVKVIMTSSELCTSSNPVTSNSINMTIFPVPAKPTITVSYDTLTSSSASGNQWYLGANLINGAVNQQYIVTENGCYTVKVTLNGCSSEMSDQENVIITGSFNPGAFGSVNLYPNPVTGKFTVDIPSMRTGEFSMSVMNSAGIVVYSSKYTFAASGHKFPVDISHLANGIYTLLIKQDDKTLTRKLILNKK